MIPNPAALQAAEEKIKDELASITVKAWSDSRFSELLQSNPREALKEMGIAWPSHIDPVFHVDGGSDRHFVIPLSPANYLAQDVEYHLVRLAKLHAEVTCTVSWASVDHKTE